MVRASGKPLAGELRMGVIPTIAPVPAADAAAAAARAMAGPQALSARGDQPGGLRRAPPRPARLRAARSALSPAARSSSAELFEDRFFVAFPPGAADALPDTVAARRDRRGQPAAARGRPLPQGPCPCPPATGPSCAPRRRSSAPRCTRSCRWSTTASAPPSSREMAIDGRHPRRHPGRRPPARRRPSLAPHRLGLAQGQPAREGVPPARRRAARPAA